MTKGERIKALRLNSGLTQTYLAEILDTTKQTVYKYENDIITNIPSDKIEILSKYFNVSPAYILGWEDSSEKVQSADIGIELYNQLDEFDKAEIRGEMKQMLKADKYNSIEKELRNA